MKTFAAGLALTVINLILLVALLARDQIALANQEAPPVLRGRALEIVDENGRVRASISVEPPVEMDGRLYPETVLLRLTDPRRGPIVKLTASDEGSALGLSDDAEGGVSLIARGRSGSYVRVVDGAGREQVLQP